MIFDKARTHVGSRQHRVTVIVSQTPNLEFQTRRVGTALVLQITRLRLRELVSS